MVVTLQPETTMTPRIAKTVWLTVLLGTSAVQTLRAQETRPPDPLQPKIRVQPTLVWTSARDRAVLGIMMGAASRADTAGVRVEEIDAVGPAAKAGIKAGDVITEINGVSLRISPADAEDMALIGVAQRRLQRTLAKAKPGEEVALKVRSGGSSRSISVKTVSAAELEGNQPRAATRTRSDEDQTGAIGVSVGASGSARDTLGLFISSVVGNGPAEKAGIIEGERIAAVNGVDVRIPREDLEDPQAASARVNRFVREVRKVAPGATLSLRVHANGRYRDVTVAAVKMSDLPTKGFEMSIGEGGIQIFRGTTPRGEALQRMPFGIVSPEPVPGAARIRGFLNGEAFEWDSESLERSMQRLRDRMQELGRDFRFEVQAAPRGKADGGVRRQPTPRRTMTVL